MTEPAAPPTAETPVTTPAPGTPGGAATQARPHGWGYSLRYRGRPLVERSVRDPAPLCIGEDPACALVVPGLGDARTLASADRLHALPGLGGTIHRAGQGTGDRLDRELTLAPGDRAELRFVDHPEITLELRREVFERVPLSTLVNFRDLAQQLLLGAGLIAGLALLVRNQTPVNVLEVKGDPDADEDSALVRAMFAIEVPQVELFNHHRIVAIPDPVIVEPAPPVPEDEAAPIPLAAKAEAVPVLPAAADRKPGKRKQRRQPEVLEMQMLAALSTASDDSVFADDLGVPGGIVGGVIGRSARDDLLAELNTDAPAPALIGNVPDEVPVDAAFEDAIAVAAKVEEVVQEAPVEFVEDIMGPGVVDMPTPLPEPVLKDIPAPPGTSSHAEPGTAEVARGAMNGLAAVTPDVRCEDPGMTRQRQLDVVFVVDVSTTMAFMLGRIEEQIAQVDAEARAQGLDTRYGLVVFVDDFKLGNAGKPYADLAALQAELATWRAFTASNRQINSPDRNLDWPENTLDAVHAAATDFAWRPADTTLRMIVHATDDDFGEAPAIHSGQAIKHNYADTVAALQHAQVRMFSFAAKVGGQCECLDVRPGLYTRFHGKPSLPDATGGAVFDIDEVARGKLGFAAAVGGAIKSGVCTRYPVPFGGPQ